MTLHVHTGAPSVQGGQKPRDRAAMSLWVCTTDVRYYGITPVEWNDDKNWYAFFCFFSQKSPVEGQDEQAEHTEMRPAVVRPCRR